MRRWTKIRYKCSCMSDEGWFMITERRELEPITKFMSRLTDELTADHAARSPLCTATNVEWCKIPVGDNGVTGGAEGHVA